MLPDKPVLRCINCLGIFAKIGKIAAYKREVGFERINTLDAANPFHCFLLKNITTESVNCIGGVNDDSAFAQNVSSLFDQPGLWIFGMYLYKDRQSGNCPGFTPPQQLIEVAFSFFSQHFINLKLQLIFITSPFRFIKDTKWPG